MKRNFICIALVIGFLFPLPLWADSLAGQSKAAKAVIHEMMMKMQSTMKQAMKAGGPVSAIQTCNVDAPLVEKAFSKEGWKVARRSLKVRNPSNQPDSWERRVLLQFEQRKSKGEPVGKMEFAEIIETDGKKTFRYMKAIGTKPMCLQCHGASLAPNVSASLEELYPEDQAKGFQVGDIRGAFSLQKSL